MQDIGIGYGHWPQRALDAMAALIVPVSLTLAPAAARDVVFALSLARFGRTL